MLLPGAREELGRRHPWTASADRVTGSLQEGCVGLCLLCHPSCGWRALERCALGQEAAAGTTGRAEQGGEVISLVTLAEGQKMVTDV